jgi:hypothetical protein
MDSCGCSTKGIHMVTMPDRCWFHLDEARILMQYNEFNLDLAIRPFLRFYCVCLKPRVPVGRRVICRRLVSLRVLSQMGICCTSLHDCSKVSCFASSIGPRTERCNSEDSDNSTRQARCTCHFRWQDVHLRPHDTFEQSCRLVQHISQYEDQSRKQSVQVRVEFAAS